MNTTKLISHWTMNGVVHDVDSHFRATDDIGSVIADNQPKPEPTPPAGSSFLIKEVDDESWQSLGE